MSSVTLVHLPKAEGRNEMQFRMDTRVLPRNIVLDGGGGPCPPRTVGDLGVRSPSSHDAACHQITLAVVRFMMYISVQYLSSIQRHE